ncbi:MULTISPECIES: two-component system response regulator TorR [Vibrio]|uniref:Two-component system response regulator TorR n=2 Tax=Vibrio TaxID=662 RepID=A0A7X4LNH3_9VIBR|nr:MULTISPECIES: two-component system response regulator TorR [Vibrio]MBF9000767.1 two-component system response regulator TorR [Vibrio nitrifigilis]MZI95207.1 two-component system response regulator TorR [Vibrio eleionomae]
MSYHLLVVEGDADTRVTLVDYFKQEGYHVSETETGGDMREILRHQLVDVVLMDAHLARDDSLMLTRELRSHSDVGIILVNGREDSIDRIIGLEMGADDYIARPFELRELLVRVKNLIWRVSKAREGGADQSEQQIHFGDWSFDIQRRLLSQNGEPIKLTKAEYELLVALASNPHQVLTREAILNMISHRVDAPNDRTIDVLIRRLRSKMEQDPKTPQIIVTVHGEGYMFAGN